MSNLSCYQIIRPLGGGTFGRVKCNIHIVARHLITSALVAIKVLNKAEIKSKNLYLKVKREIKILRSFHHPNIIRLYDIVESSNSLLIVMEFLPGGELYNIIEQNRLSEDQVRMYFLQIFSGLEYIHTQGYSHRDIKLENLMLDQENKVKIGDFGLSNVLKQGDFLKTQCGSPNYAAPEVISGEKYCGSEVDVWSLGVVLYALVARELPFDDPSIPALFARIKSGSYKFQHHFSDSLKDLIARMLNIDPIARITISQIKKHNWLKTSPLYEITLSCTEQIRKLYYNLDLCRKVLYHALEYQEFKNMTYDQAEGIVKKRQNNDRYDGENDDISTTYNILLDIELQSRKIEIEKTLMQSEPVFKQTNLQSLSERTTEGSSQISDFDDRFPPLNWVYGFRSNLQYCYLSIKLFECFKSIGLNWKAHSKSTLILKGNCIKFRVIFYKFEDVIVIDFTLRKGPVVHFFEVLNKVYTYIYKFTHI
ncbi:hypothetical protein SteCoe_27187 [Stentor coeruleus]|uniref:Protein kinase domain-containing protein n=1 Tax=Stentor coeruleus TaxID=5963 RepID=A0A1R2BBF5_9CILI|nr:hypothetical protein SteCoe_27187 [Stentor coeruleus]